MSEVPELIDAELTPCVEGPSTSSIAGRTMPSSLVRRSGPVTLGNASVAHTARSGERQLRRLSHGRPHTLRLLPGVCGY
jgi:hypothetical protein